MSGSYHIEWKREGTWYRGDLDLRAERRDADEEMKKTAEAIVKGLREAGYIVEATRKHTIEEKL